MKKILMVAGAAMVAAGATPAFAQEEGAYFSGPYVGAIVGYDKARLSSPVDSSSRDGVLYGGVVGFDTNVGGAVVGLEAEYSDSNTRYRTRDVLVAGDRFSINSGRDIYGGVRIGGEVAPNIMLYAKGGYTNAKLKAVYDDGAGLRVTDSEKMDGYRLGGGIEYGSGPLLGRLEYRYSNYGRFPGTTTQFQKHQVAVVAGYRF